MFTVPKDVVTWRDAAEEFTRRAKGKSDYTHILVDVCGKLKDPIEQCRFAEWITAPDKVPRKYTREELVTIPERSNDICITPHPGHEIRGQIHVENGMQMIDLETRPIDDEKRMYSPEEKSMSD